MKSYILFGVFGLLSIVVLLQPTDTPQPKKKRVPWTTSKIKGSLEPPALYRCEPVFANLKFEQPVDLVKAPGTQRLFMVELGGKIFSFPNKQDVKKPNLFADLQADLKSIYRVYALEFHPDFEKNRQCYICYVVDKKEQENGTRVSQFTVTKTDPPRLEPNSEKILITWRSGGHNGCCLKFGPDGYLYISAGDSGPAFPPDPLNTGQNIEDLSASTLRIDVDQTEPGKAYRIPPDNPFVKTPGARGEIWAYGMRNPWRMSFDPDNGALWVGDVGWELWEMVYRVEKGANYGWSLVEGPQPVHPERKRGPTPVVKPTIVHSHTEARSITGGFVYNGDRLKKLRGVYIYGDYVTGKIWGAKHDGKKITWHKELADTPLEIITFGIDHQNELYVVDYKGGIFRLVPNKGQSANTDFPRKLSQTGLFASVKEFKPAPGVLPYRINAEPWIDGAKAERFLALPGLSQLGIHKKQNVWIGHIKGDWAFPQDSVLAKTISLPTAPNEWRRVETQVLHLDGDTWRAYNYIWNDEQTDAVLSGEAGFDRKFTIADPKAPGGKRSQTWHFAGRTECILCHTTRAGSIHGFKMPQVDPRDLNRFDRLGVFQQPLSTEHASWTNPHDKQGKLSDRARAYLHVNCAHCHRRGGGGTAAIDLQITQSEKNTNMYDERPTQGTFELFDARVVAPGDPYRSVLWYRMAKIGKGHMPQFGSNVIDERGLKLIHDWIRSLPAKKESVAAKKLRGKQRKELRAYRKQGDKKALSTLLSSTSGSLLLLRALNEGKISEKAREEVITQAVKLDKTHVRDLFERFLPEDKRRKTLGSVIRPQTILALKGDVARGKTLYWKSSGTQCRSCHKIGKEGFDIGPDLTTVGKKYNRAQILDEILAPSKTIDPKFSSFLVETKQGLVHFGLLVRRSEKEVVIRTAQNKEVRINGKDVLLVTPLQKSLMPELQLSEMTAPEVADLLAYLESLK